MIKLKENTSGVVEISDEVIAVIANTSALEVEGIAGTENNFANGKGIYYDKKGNILYDGDFVDDKREGNGQMIDKDGSYYIG